MDGLLKKVNDDLITISWIGNAKFPLGDHRAKTNETK